jgi:hypothetical protein
MLLLFVLYCTLLYVYITRQNPFSYFCVSSKESFVLFQKTHIQTADNITVFLVTVIYFTETCSYLIQFQQLHIKFRNVSNKHKVTRYGLDCRSLQAMSRVFFSRALPNLLCVTHDISNPEQKGGSVPGTKWAKQENPSASGTEVTSAWDNSHIHFSFIFIVPCIVIFYGITNRCHNVQ